MEDILQIDEHQLNKECVRLPNQYRQAAFQAADTAMELDEVKSELEVREAEKALKIRTADPKKFGLEKLTEGSLKEMIRIEPGIIALESKLRKLTHKLAMEKALVSALEIKKRSLTNLVELHAAGYHAEVRPSSEGRKVLDNNSRSRKSRPIPWNRKEKDRDVD